MSDSIDGLILTLRAFAEEREWERFHTPKNLVMAVCAEAGELAAELQWLSDAEADTVRQESDVRKRVEDEMADVFIYLTRLADVCEIDLLHAAKRKVEVNRRRFRADRVKGRADKALREP